MCKPIVNTSPPLRQPTPSFKPQIVYSKNMSEAIGVVLNTTIDAVNATLQNTSSQLVSAATKMKPTEASSSIVGVMGDSLNISQTTTAAPLTDNLKAMTTTSLSEEISQLSLVHLFAWILLFAAITLMTVILLNCCLHSQKDSAYSAAKGDDAEEMHGKAAVLPSVSTPSPHPEGPSSGTSSSTRLLASRGNLARQQFLESRKTGSAAKCYGGTDSTSAAA
nr:unnamed protein product [Leishmania braziliensis]